MKRVILEGFLGEKYGREWEVRGNSYGHIFSCIEANYPGFRQDLIDYYHVGGDLSILSGSELMIDAEEMFLPLDADTIVITPIPSGSKSGGAKILLAIAIVAVAFWNPAAGALIAKTAAVTGATVTAITTVILTAAVNLAITGIQQLLAPDPSVDVDADENYLFNGPQEVVSSGNPVPVLLGEMIVGGITMSSAIVPGLSSYAGHIGGFAPGVGGIIDLVGGGSGGFGGVLATIFSNLNDTTLTQPSYDVINAYTGAGLTTPDPSIVLYSANEYRKPWVATAPKNGVHFISPVIPHEIPSNLLNAHRQSILRDLYSEPVDWDNFEPVTIGAVPINAVMFRTLEGISLEALVDFASAGVIGSASNTLEAISIFAQSDVPYIGTLEYTLDSVDISSVGSITA